DGKSTRNTLSMLSRWKILDNLRRIAIAPLELALVAAAWFLIPHGAWIVGVGVAALILFPAFQASAREMMAAKRDVPIAMHLRQVLTNGTRTFVQHIFSLFVLVFEALMSVDATLRTWWRLIFSKR